MGVATILGQRWRLESPWVSTRRLNWPAKMQCSSSLLLLRWPSSAGLEKTTFFTKIVPLCSRLTAFGHYLKHEFKNSQKCFVFERFILGHFEPSPPHLARSRRDLGVNAALHPKNAPLCSRLLVFLKSAPSRRRKRRKTHGLGSVLKMSATLQPFACFASKIASRPQATLT